MTEAILHSLPGASRTYQSRKFALLLACASMIMLFAALTSAYIVRKAAGNWLEFRLPDMFAYSTAVLLLSSLTAAFALRSFNRQDVLKLRLFASASLLLGVIFLFMQYLGWQSLLEIGVALDGNPSGSFIYVISGIHAAHVLGGLAAWFLSLRIAFRPFRFTERRKHQLEMVNIYWHFVDVLWVYLFIFFIVQ